MVNDILKNAEEQTPVRGGNLPPQKPITLPSRENPGIGSQSSGNTEGSNTSGNTAADEYNARKRSEFDAEAKRRGIDVNTADENDPKVQDFIK